MDGEAHPWPARIRLALLTIGAVLGLFCLLVTAAAVATQSSVMIVKSGSMQPALPIGSVLLARPVPADSVQAGRIIGLRKADGRIVVHRVQSIESAQDGSPVRSIVLKGDANTVADQPVSTVTALDPVVTLAWSWPGRVVGVLQSRWAQFWMGVASGMLAMAELIRVRRDGDNTRSPGFVMAAPHRRSRVLTSRSG